MSTKSPPFFALTEDDNGGVAVVSALCMIVITSSVAIIRYIVAARQEAQFKSDDATFYLSSVLAFISTICVYRAVLAGLGRHIESLQSQSLSSYYKLMYTAQLFSVLSMFSAKLSVVLLFKRIAQTKHRSILLGVLMCFIWGIFAIFALAFQCQFPRPWEYIPSECNTHGYLHFPLILSNMITDAVLSAVILPTIWKLNMPRDTRTTVMTLFGLRLLVCVGAIMQLVSVARARTNIDQPWANLASSIWMMIVTHLSVITATVPRTHSFWASLQSGKTGTAITEFELSNNSKSSRFVSLSDGSDHRHSKTSKPHSQNWSKAQKENIIRSGSRTQFRSPQSPSRQIEERSSQEPLRLTPNQQADIRTRIYSEAATGEILPDAAECDDGSAIGLAHTSTGDFGVWREREVRVEVEYHGKSRK